MKLGSKVIQRDATDNTILVDSWDEVYLRFEILVGLLLVQVLAQTKIVCQTVLQSQQSRSPTTGLCERPRAVSRRSRMQGRSQPFENWPPLASISEDVFCLYTILLTVCTTGK